MFCTGGIRCEKASVFLKKKGFGKASVLFLITESALNMVWL